MTVAQPTQTSSATAVEHGPDEVEAIAFLRALITAQATGEAAVQALITQKLTEAGAVVENRPFDPAMVPVVGEFRRGAVPATGRAGECDRQTAGRCGAPVAADVRPSRQRACRGHRGLEPRSLCRRDRYGQSLRLGVADDLAGIAAGTLAVARAARAGDTLGEVIMISAPPNAMRVGSRRRCIRVWWPMRPSICTPPKAARA